MAVIKVLQEPSEYSFSSSPEYKELLHLVSRNEEKLLSTMTQEQKELFSRYSDCVRKFQSLAEQLQTGGWDDVRNDGRTT